MVEILPVSVILYACSFHSFLITVCSYAS